MSPSWEPFGSTRRLGEDPEAAPADVPPAPDLAAPGRLDAIPRHRLVIITCMDGRIDPLAICGLGLGDAHVLRNAGAVVSDDVLRSLHASHARLGTQRALLIGHTDCRAFDSDLAQVEASLRQGVQAIAGSGAVPPSFEVQALVYELETGQLRPL